MTLVAPVPSPAMLGWLLAATWQTVSSGKAGGGAPGGSVAGAPLNDQAYAPAGVCVGGMKACG